MQRRNFLIVIAMSKIGASDHETSFTATKADIYIIDEDDSTASHSLSDYLSSMHNPVTLKDTDTMTLQDALYYQNVDYILTIPEGFEEQLTDSDARDFLPVSMRKDNSNGYFVDQQVTEYHFPKETILRFLSLKKRKRMVHRLDLPISSSIFLMYSLICCYLV